MSDRDFIDGLRRDLVQAARRRLHKPAIRRRLRASRRGLMIAVVGLVGAGSATAAAVGLTAQPSAPLAGPRDVTPSARGYAVSLLPAMRAGHAGWCGLVRFTTAGRLTSAGMSCGHPRAAGANMIAGGEIFGRGKGMRFVIVTAQVRAVRFGERVVATRADRTLPYGWRYAITLADGAGAATPGLGQTTTTPPAAIALDADGRSLPATTAADRRARGAATRRVTATKRAPRCAIGSADGFRVSYARVALGQPTLPARLEGRAFATCARAVFRVAGRRGSLSAMIWLHALDPARRADRLPPTPGLSGRRIGPGWLAVYGASPAQRARLLAGLRPRL